MVSDMLRLGWGGEPISKLLAPGHQATAMAKEMIRKVQVLIENLKEAHRKEDVLLCLESTESLKEGLSRASLEAAQDLLTLRQNHKDSTE